MIQLRKASSLYSISGHKWTTVNGVCWTLCVTFRSRLHPLSDMPPRKRATKQEDSDSDASTERANDSDDHKQFKPKAKRRVSEIQPDNLRVPLNDGPENSDSEEEYRASPSKGAKRQSNMGLNDDAAEKRKRRMSAKQSVAFMAPLNAAEREAARRARETGAPDEDPNVTPKRQSSGSGPRTPKASALARANQLNLVAQTPNPQVPVDVVNSKYEEWMKLATDNVSSLTSLLAAMLRCPP